MAWGPIWKRQDDAQLCVCAEPGCTRRAELQRRCWHCGRRFCPAHILEQVDEQRIEQFIQAYGLKGPE